MQRNPVPERRTAVKIGKLLGLICGLFWLAATPALAATRPAWRYALVLDAPPVAQAISSRAELFSPAGEASRRAVAAQQERVRATLRTRGIAVLGSVDVVANAVFVRATADKAAALAALPGVARVERMGRLKRNLDKALPLVNASAGWNGVGGQASAGAGVKIGILDSGIDITHPAMQDPTLSVPAGFPKCRAQSDCNNYTNKKVIVARSYVDLLVDAAEPVYSRPDDLSARDRMGHGTAMAMIAAGRQVSAPNATISGVAPKAWLASYKIFGSPGVNDFSYKDAVLMALDDAVKDGIDVVALGVSRTALWGSNNLCNGQPCDLYTDAVAKATTLGLTVVAGAGNGGNTGTVFPALGTTESPGTAPSAITVGASTNSHFLVQTLSVTGADVPASLTEANAIFGNGPRPDAPLTAPARDVTNLDGSGLACAPLPAGSLTGTLALIARGTCDLDVKVINAENAGAVAVVIYQYTGVDFIDRVRFLDQTGIPTVLVGNSDGVALKSFLASHADRPVTLDPGQVPLDNQYYDEVAAFSSQGPAMGTFGIKPELVAPGTDLYTAAQTYDPNGDVYDKSGYSAVEGTSFSAPFVAGAVALVKQKNKAFTPAQLKSAVVNTANNTGLVDYDTNGAAFPARVSGVGAGKLDVGAAVSTNVTVDPAVISFGVVGSPLPSATLRFTNSGSSAVNLTLAVNQRDQDNNAQVSLSATTLAVAAGQSGTVTARLTGKTPAAGSYEGVIAVTGGAVPLRIPYLYLVGNGVPAIVYPIENAGFVGNAGEPVPDLYIGLKVLDKFGVPVANTPVLFKATVGGGSINAGTYTTDSLGIAEAEAQLGSSVGDQEFTGTAGNIAVVFAGRSRTPPAINDNGITDGASFRTDVGIAPGSYITIKGAGFAEIARGFSTGYLPLSLSTVSVSFDTANNTSLPGHLSYVSPGQVNVQVPWELAGQTSAQVKVSLGIFSTALYTVQIKSYTPGFFEYQESASGPSLIAALDTSYKLLGSSNPARRGSVVQLYANGLGPVSNTPPSGEVATATPLSDCQSPPTLTIGGRPAPVGFCGLTPGTVGLYQLNVTVPADAPTGAQSVIMTQQGVTAKTSNLYVQ
jgi:minor extracellular serine protease Vpr